MSDLNSFLERFGASTDETAPMGEAIALTQAPGALDAFIDRFANYSEEYHFYGGEITLRFDKEEHRYFLVDSELGNLTPLYNVSTITKIVDKSNALVPWASKMCAEKLLKTVPTVADPEGTLSIPAMSFEAFTTLVLEAKNAHKERLEDAGNIGKIAHACIEDSIKWALDNNQGIVLELKNPPSEPRALSCASAALDWMQKHNVRFLATERKVYSKKHKVAGTLDGVAWTDSCDDPVCCLKAHKDHLSLIDWKTSNALYSEYVYQTSAYLKFLIEEFYRKAP